MRRPSFQFYPGDWSSNPNLRRCTFAEKGVWLEVMCLMHDQDSYGMLRWPLKEIAQAVGCSVKDLEALVRKGVLKGSDGYLSEPFIYTPRSGRKDGEPVQLVAEQNGPIWYSSRMVKDEYVRTIRGESSGNGDAPKPTPKTSPKPPLGEDIGATFGPRVSSSSSSTSVKTPPNPLKGAASPDRKRGNVHEFPPGFEAFWSAYPRKTAKPAAAKAFARLAPNTQLLARMLAAVAEQAQTPQWIKDGGEFIPHPATWLNQRRWEDSAASVKPTGTDPFEGCE
jgi:hypothetical protein